MKVYGKSGGEDFPDAPEGLHQGVCVDVIDRGLVEFEWEGQKKKRKELVFVFQIHALDDDDKEIRRNDGKRFTASQKFTASLAKNAKLGPFLESWLGTTLSDEVREEGFEMDKLIGRNAQINLSHRKASNGKTYTNITGILPVPKKQAKLVPEDYVRVQDRPGYVPPVGSEKWEEQQAEKQQSSEVEGDQHDAFDGDGDEEDDLPF